MLSATKPFFQEQRLGIHYSEGSDLLDYLVPGKGFTTQGGPRGLGIEVNEPHVDRMLAKGHRWRAPVWRLKDGSIAEW